MGFVKVFISFDMEGVAGIVDWAQCRPPGQAYEEGRALLLGEVNAAIDGAMAAGANEFILKPFDPGQIRSKLTAIGLAA